MDSQGDAAPARTQTQAIETAVDPDVIWALLADPRHIPAWAPAFADAITGSEHQGWQAVKDGRGFALRVACARAQRTVDYLGAIAPGREGGAYLRVLARPGGGSVIVMTLPLTPGTGPETVTANLRAELAALARLAGTA
jgi:Polyketide cyclase / dehydrase and lipid transport